MIQFTERNVSQEETDKNTNLNPYVSEPRTEGCTRQPGKRENMLMLSKKKKKKTPAILALAEAFSAVKCF